MELKQGEVSTERLTLSQQRGRLGELLARGGRGRAASPPEPPSHTDGAHTASVGEAPSVQRVPAGASRHSPTATAQRRSHPRPRPRKRRRARTREPGRTSRRTRSRSVAPPPGPPRRDGVLLRWQRMAPGGAALVLQVRRRGRAAGSRSRTCRRRGRSRPAPSSTGSSSSPGAGYDEHPIAETVLYDPASDTWSSAAPNPAPFAASGTAVLNGAMYVVGGCLDNDCGRTDVLRYDPQADTVDPAGRLPAEHCVERRAADIRGKVYCTGGIGAGADQHRQSSPTTRRSDSWTRVADQPLDMWASAYTVVEDRLVVVGRRGPGSLGADQRGLRLQPRHGQLVDAAALAPRPAPLPPAPAAS